MSDEDGGELHGSDLDGPSAALEEEDRPLTWQVTRVESIQELREAEVESKKFELHREQEELDLSLAGKDVHVQKQVRAITEECGKLRLEVSWLERDLSQVKETARRHILEIQTMLQSKKLKMKDGIHQNERRIQELEKKIADQREENTRAVVRAKIQVQGEGQDVAVQIVSLTDEIDVVRRQLYQMNRKYEEETAEVKQTSDMLLTEIRNIQGRRAGLELSIQKQQAESQQLQEKREKFDQVSKKLRHKVRNLTDSRTAMRARFEESDQRDWTHRVQSLISFDQAPVSEP
jgi:chromosome segregation ATPase